MYSVVSTFDPSQPFLNTGLLLFGKATTKPETAHWLIVLLTSYMQPACSFTLYSNFRFFTAGHSSTPSCTLCHLARSLCWQSSRRSPIKRDFLNLHSYPGVITVKSEPHGGRRDLFFMARVT